MTPAQKQARRAGLGSSEIADLCLPAALRWRTPLEIYLDKVGLLPEEDDEEVLTGYLRRGTDLEPLIRAMVMARTGEILVTTPLAARAEHPWQLASCDALATLVGAESPSRWPVELKTADWADPREWGAAGSQRYPLRYALQLAQQQAVLGPSCQRGQLACLFIREWELRIYEQPRDDSLIHTLTQIGSAFWHRHVVPRIPPPPDWAHPRTAKLLGYLHRPQRGKVVALGSQASVWAEDYGRLGDQARRLEAERELVKAQLIAALADAEVGELPAGGRVSRRLVTRRGYRCSHCGLEGAAQTSPRFFVSPNHKEDS